MALPNHQPNSLVVYWSRRDFRLDDNPALTKAIKVSQEKSLPFLPIFILDSHLISDKHLAIGRPRLWYLAQVLPQFTSQFKCFGIFEGDPLVAFQSLLQQFTIFAFTNDDIEPYSRLRDKRIQSIFDKDSRSKCEFLPDQLTVDCDVRTGNGALYSVFTPFKNRVWDQFIQAPVVEPVKLSEILYASPDLLEYKAGWTVYTQDNPLKESDLSTLYAGDWQCYYTKTNFIDLGALWGQVDLSNWYTSEITAQEKFRKFVHSAIHSYAIERNNLRDESGVSYMSVALKWGLVSSRNLVKIIVDEHGQESLVTNPGIQSYVSELLWREFYRYLLYHHPSILDTEFQEKYRNSICWVDQETAITRFEAWVKGQTGYRIVDAAMHELARTGWMHNRTRMIVGSVLSKNLGVDWRWGQQYFRSMLLDCDEASNNGGWQWAASVGADPKPIRIFNPYLQMERFDPQGEYQKRWLPKEYNLHKPIVDHAQARLEALRRYKLA